MATSASPVEALDTIYSAAHFRPQAPPAAAYAVYFCNSSHQIRLAQPLEAPYQAYRTAALQGLLAALRVASCLHLRNVHLLLDDRHLVDLFLAHRSKAEDGFNQTIPTNSLNRRVSAPVHVHTALDINMWRSILTIADNHVANGGALSVSHASDAALMPIVRNLAEGALSLHQLCPGCNRNYGPPGTPHQCSSSPPVIDQQLDAMGRVCVAGAVCPNCNQQFQHLSSLEKHLESDCPEVLLKWFSHTKIVKL